MNRGILLLLLLLTLSCTVPTARPASPRPDPDGNLWYSLPEEQPPGTIVARLEADADLASRYEPEVLSSLVFDVFRGPHSDKFRVDSPDGSVRTNRTIDRDEICSKLDTCVIRLDVAIIRPAQYFRIFKLSLTISDVNDNAPRFDPPTLSLSLSESAAVGSRFLLPAAVDADNGHLDVQTYELVTNASAGTFRLLVTGNGPDSGPTDVALVVGERLDRERVSVYTGRLTARDGGEPPKSGTLDIVITVQDANDNSPKFDVPEYNVTVREDFPVNGIIVTVHAVDDDEGANGRVVYAFAQRTIAAHGDTFAVDADRGAISLRRRLDYESAVRYSLVVGAVDGGPDAAASYARVIVNVEDRNDNAPEIRVNALTAAGVAEVVENLPVGSFVAHLSVVDQDSGPNGQVTCELLRSGGQFVLDPLPQPSTAEYKLLTQAVFDRELTAEYTLTIVCHDAGVPSLSSSRDLVVRVLDANDNPPQFDRAAYTAAVPEDADPGLPILRLSATDRDAGPNGLVSFRLCAGGSGEAAGDAVQNELVAVSEATGWLTTLGRFDYEKSRQVRLCVAVVDAGSPALTSTASVQLNVVDVNDEAPTFDKPAYSFGTFENQPADTEIGRLAAVDRDSPPFDRFVYGIAREVPALGAFAIDPRSGRLATTRPLDREQTSVHQLVVSATDVGRGDLVGVVNVTVFVADRNDNAPIISFPSHDNNTVEVSRHTPIGYVITRVFAHDVDFAGNARLTFRVVDGDPESLFDIDPVLGAVSVHSDLRRAVHDRYDLLVDVADAGQPEKSSSVHLVVELVVGGAADWSERQRAGGGETGSEGSGDALYGQHGLLLIGLGAASVLLVLFLVFVIVFVRCRQTLRKRRRAKYQQQAGDPKLSANLIIQNVPRTAPKDARLNVNTLSDQVPSLNYQPSTNCSDVYDTGLATIDQCRYRTTQPTSNFERTGNPHIRTVTLPFRGNQYTRTQGPQNCCNPDEVAILRCQTLQQIQQQYCVRPAQQQPHQLQQQQQSCQHPTAGPHSPSGESADSTSGFSSTGASTSDRDGSPRHRPYAGRLDGVADDDEQEQEEEDDGVDVGTPAAAAAAAPGPHHSGRLQPCPVLPPQLTLKRNDLRPSGPCTSGCCSCASAVQPAQDDRPASSAAAASSRSLGSGYCCTVQPIAESDDVDDCCATSSSVDGAAAIAAAIWKDVGEVSERNLHGAGIGAGSLDYRYGGDAVVPGGSRPSAGVRSPCRAAAHPPPLPPPRHTSLKRDQSC